MVVPAAGFVPELLDAVDDALDADPDVEPATEADDGRSALELDELDEIEELDELDELDEFDEPPDPVEELLPHALTINAMADTTVTPPIMRRGRERRRAARTGLAGGVGW